MITMGKREKRILAVLIGGIAFWMIAIEMFSRHYAVGINVTPSLPYRFIAITKGFDESELKKNEIIGFSFGFDSPYDNYKKGAFFAKRLACMPGDELTTEGRVHYCNGFPLGSALLFDSKGKPVKEFFDYNGTVPLGKYYVQGDHSHSYDSRYWGFVDKEQIIGVKAWAY